MSSGDACGYCDTTNTARDYYNSSDADCFYYTIWGGEDIHIGLYNTPDEDVFAASRRSVEHLDNLLGPLAAASRVLDMGAGFGGTARYLARKYGCSVMALNLSEKQNCRDREMNEEQGLADLVEVVDGSFDDVPAEDGSFDAVISQDAILHAPDRAKVLAEAARVLKPGGVLVFTDPMQADDCPEGVLQPILDRIHLESLGSPGFYKKTAEKLGLTFAGYDEKTEHLATHYRRVREETEKNEPELEKVVSREYIERMKKGLSHWVEGGNNNHLTWGYLQFRKA